MFNDGATREIGLVVPVQGEMIECTSLAEAAALRQAAEVLAGDGTRDSSEANSLAVALFKYKHYEIARQLNILANRRRIDESLRRPD